MAFVLAEIIGSREWISISNICGNSGNDEGLMLLGLSKIVTAPVSDSPEGTTFGESDAHPSIF